MRPACRGRWPRRCRRRGPGWRRGQRVGSKPWPRGSDLGGQRTRRRPRGTRRDIAAGLPTARGCARGDGVSQPVPSRNPPEPSATSASIRREGKAGPRVGPAFVFLAALSCGESARAETAPAQGVTIPNFWNPRTRQERMEGRRAPARSASSRTTSSPLHFAGPTARPPASWWNSPARSASGWRSPARCRPALRHPARRAGRPQGDVVAAAVPLHPRPARPLPRHAALFRWPARFAPAPTGTCPPFRPRARGKERRRGRRQRARGLPQGVLPGRDGEGLHGSRHGGGGRCAGAKSTTTTSSPTG